MGLLSVLLVRVYTEGWPVRSDIQGGEDCSSADGLWEARLQELQGAGGRRKEITLTCKHPDRDCPKLMCGYPLPCRYHTATIDATVDPPVATIPITAQTAWDGRHRLAEIGEAVKSSKAGSKTKA